MSNARTLGLGILAALLLVACAIGLVRSLLRSSQPAPADTQAQSIDEKGGWFPAHQDPLFGWEKDAEGWILETDAAPETAARSPSPGAGTAPGPIPNAGDAEREAGENPAAPGGEDVALATAAGGGKASLEIGAERSREGAHSLKVPVRFPDSTTIQRSVSSLSGKPSGLQGVSFIAYDVFVPEEAHGYVGCLFFLKDKDGLWYQARAHSRLLPGRWTTVSADLRGGSPDVAPLGHLGQWEENQASQVRTIGITFYGDRSFAGQIWLDNFRGWMRPEPFQKMLAQLRQEDADAGPASNPRDRGLTATKARIDQLNQLKEQASSVPAEPPAILNLRSDPLPAAGRSGEESSPLTLGRCQTLTLRFELNRQVANPFDPALADVQLQVEAPSGRITRVFGFWYQEFEARADFAGEALTPVGRPEWQVRFTPREEGEHRATLEVRLAGEAVLTAPPLVFMVAPTQERGFLRVSAQDPHFFEFENGAFFYPLGHNAHTPVDLRSWEKIFKKDPPLFRGLNMYLDFFPKMEAAGENVTEVWMASWWLGLEWSRRWRHYYGAGRYSLERAWLLDRLMAEARKHGLRVHLVIDNHGKFSQWCDWEWEQNPYKLGEPGGMVASPGEFFTDARARELHRRRLRYIAARWGPDPYILGWELVSEFDLVGDGRPGRGTQVGQPINGRNYCRSEPARAWAREMSGALRACDPYEHPITIHYATDFNFVDRQLVDGPGFDYITGDAYRAEPGFAGMALANTQAFSTARKPYWITEFGGDWSATSEARLKADLHCGLWASWMTPTAGTPLFWWYDFIERRNLYPHYRAFANFVQGEDRRGQNGTTERMMVQGNAEGLSGLQYRWSDGAYAWIYNERAMAEAPAGPGPKQSGVSAQVLGLSEGPYRIEYWDTWAGKLVRWDKVVVEPGAPLSLSLPVFESDMAIKVKKGNLGPAVPRPPAGGAPKPSAVPEGTPAPPPPASSARGL